MTFDLWTHQFCLACDKQVQSDGAAYCSESCRLADHETTSTPGSSPGLTPPAQSYPWSSPAVTTSPRLARSKLHLPPPFDFARHSKALPCQSTPTHGYLDQYAMYSGHASTPSNLTPSSSHSSLCSMQSTASSVDAAHLSDKSRQELKAYAISFEQVRFQRRRSY
ncbi:hypothetical protein CDD83_6638 [Cordyceps sp. RAO-2017]|nr:hypothetical protein CDD83_6638 [Cordyceps sp. RAO-2017]